jgi:hemerythrin
MTIFEWKDDLSVGINEIDEQHKELINKLNQLAESILQKKGKGKIVMILNFMKDYGGNHFTCEERYMAKSNYPGLESQKKQHEKFKNTVTRLINELDTEKDMEFFASQVQRFLIDWLILHIRTEDQKYGGFLLQNRDDKN